MRHAFLISVLLAVALAASSVAGPEEWDQRFGVVATDGGGWGYSDPFVPMQGPDYFDPLRTAWWYNYSPRLISYQKPGLTLFWPGYQRLYMFWRAVAATSDAQIQEYARAAKAADPTRTIWWAMSNEPNDYGQANQSATDFAAIYYKHHRNLKIGDPSCKIMGPGILNWGFQSTSVWQTGRNWYQEFRNAWYNDPTFRQYSEDNYGVSYPPLDAFALHTYDLRGVQGTPWAPESWKWCRDELAACHADLQTWPETAGKKIWNTEFGGLRSPTRAEYANAACPLVLYMRDTPWIERWFWFILNSDNNGGWRQAELMDFPNTPSSLGLAYRDLSLLTVGTDFHNVPYHSDYSSHAAYARPGWTPTSSISENDDTGMRFYLNSTFAYAAGQMRGRTFAFPNKRIRRVTFNYNTIYDHTRVHLGLDSTEAGEIWKLDQSGSVDGYADLDLSADPPLGLSFGLFVTAAFTFTEPTGAHRAIVSNVTFYLVDIPSKPVVSSHLLVQPGDPLTASWLPPESKTGIAGYEYALGASPGGADVFGWTPTTENMATVPGLALTPGQQLYFSVRARSGEGYWSDSGVSAPISVVASTAVSTALASQDGTAAAIDGIITAGSVNLIGLSYVQSPDRSCAVRVDPLTTSPSTTPGDRVQVMGTLSTVSRERRIVSPVIQVISSGTPPVPLGMSAALIAGRDLGTFTQGIGGDGLFSVGLLARVWGRVTKVDQATKYLYLDDGSGLRDGSGNTGLRIYWGQTRGSVAAPPVGSFAMATGISGMRALGTTGWMRQVRLRSGDDLVAL